MPRSRTAGFAAGVLAALLWSPHFYVVRHFLAGAEEVNVLVFYLYVVFWGAVASLLVMLLSGRTEELSIFKRTQTHFLALVVTGGYGFWLLRALSIQRAAEAPSHVQILFYTGPLLLGFLSLLTREAASIRQIAGLLLGFVGCILIAGSPYWGAAESGGPPSLETSLIALGAAACWAAFALMARPMVKEEKVLPVIVIVLSMGAVFLLVTCYSTGASMLIGSKRLWASMILGAAAALALGCWLKCLASAPASAAASLWYLALVFGVAWAYWIAHLSPGWFTLVGAALVLLALHSAPAVHRKQQTTMSDLIRS